MTLNSGFELLPSEKNETWVVKEAFTVEYEGHFLTIPEGFRHDKYTFAPNVPDAKPAISHDRAYDYKKWDDGTPIKRKDADGMLRMLMSISPDKLTRDCANLYWKYVRRFGWWGWYFKKTKKNANP